jgi:hypothetical protein
MQNISKCLASREFAKQTNINSLQGILAMYTIVFDKFDYTNEITKMFFAHEVLIISNRRRM